MAEPVRRVGGTADARLTGGAETTRSLVVPRHGDAEVLRWEDTELRPPGPGELQLRMRALAVNWADILQREGRYPGGRTPPFVTGNDYVGDVVALGPGVSGPAVGTRVYGLQPFAGAASELANVVARWARPAPDGLSDEELAGFASPFWTGEAALVTMGRLAPGETVVVNAAAGGTGTALVQLCRAHGAGLVIGTIGDPAKAPRVAVLGADHVLTYGEAAARVRELTGGRGADLVVDSVGGEVLEHSFDCVATATGRLVCVGATEGRSTPRFRLQTLFELGISVSGFTLGNWMLDWPEVVDPIIERVAGLLERREIRGVVGGTFSAARASDAHRFLAERRSIGRTVVVMPPPAAH
jgi:NADPH2:quinone reductase